MKTDASSLKFTSNVRFKSTSASRREKQQMMAPVTPVGHVPRIARLMALAIKLQGMLERGEVRDCAEIARLGHVTRARVTQIMNLLNLAPSIQEALLCLPPVKSGRSKVREWQLRPLAAELNWRSQIRRWRAIEQ